MLLMAGLVGFTLGLLLMLAIWANKADGSNAYGQTLDTDGGTTNTRLVMTAISATQTAKVWTGTPSPTAVSRPESRP